MSNMGPDLERKEISYISKKPVLVMKDLENNHMNCEDKCLDMQVGNLEVESNTLEGTKSGGIKTVHEGWDPALTESSSSFDSDGSSFSEAEVDSELYDDPLSAFPFDEYGDLFRMRKKKLTSKWRKYVGPLMWRCKWLELQIKKFESQAQKYDREADEYNGRKPFKSCISENVNSKSLPSADQSQRKAVMKRKKRRRAEDIEDIESYMSHHNLFSYFENKKSAVDAACSEGNQGNEGAGADKTSNGTNEVGVDEELLSCEFKDGGNSLEQIFWKIGLMQLQVREMKTRAHKVLSENALRFCSTENLSLLVPCNNALTSSTENPAPLNHENKHAAAAASSISSDIVRGDSNIKMVNFSMPEAALGHGEVNHVLENIKSINLPANGGSSRNPSGAILMYNRRAKTNSSKLKEVEVVSTEKPHGPSQDYKSSALVSFSQDPEPSIPKIRSISEVMSTSTTGTTSNKRKRAMRKAGFGKWNH